MDSFPYFTELPLELQEHILSQDITILQKTPLISQYIGELMAPVYLKEVCFRPISKKEIAKYLQTKPQQLAMFKWKAFEGFDEVSLYDILASFIIQIETHEKEYSYMFTSGDACLISCNNIENYFDVDPNMNTVLYESSIDINIPNPIDYINNYDEPDLLTMYHIYQNRLRFRSLRDSELKDNLAKAYVMRYFKSIIYGGYRQWSRSLRNHILTEIQLYLYLVINANIMKIQNLIDTQYNIRVNFQLDNQGHLLLDTVHVDMNNQNTEIIKQLRNENRRLITLILIYLEDL